MPTPLGPPRTLGIGLRWGPRGVRLLVSEVPLYWCFQKENLYKTYEFGPYTSGVQTGLEMASASAISGGLGFNVQQFRGGIVLKAYRLLYQRLRLKFKFVLKRFDG